MKISDIVAVVQIANGLVSVLAIIAAAWWFLLRRRLAGTLQISITMTSSAMVNNTRLAIVRIGIKNVGQTRVKKDYSNCVFKEIKMRQDFDNIEMISAAPFNDSSARKIFQDTTEVEPNEETFEDIAFALKEAIVFAVAVKFKRKGTRELWRAIAVFNVAANDAVPSATRATASSSV